MSNEITGIVIGIYNLYKQRILWLDSRVMHENIRLRVGKNKILCRLSENFAFELELKKISVRKMSKIQAKQGRIS